MSVHDRVLARFPSVPGVILPKGSSRLPRYSYGPDEERYASHDAYVEAVARVCEARVHEGLMLQEDADRFIEAARRRNPLDPSVLLGPLIQVAVAPGG